MDMEKIINAIEKAKKQSEEYAQDRIIVPFKEADMILALLKEQEAVEPIPYHRSDRTIFKYECRKCRTKIFKGDLFCRHCGRPVKWDD